MFENKKQAQRCKRVPLMPHIIPNFLRVQIFLRNFTWNPFLPTQQLWLTCQATLYMFGNLSAFNIVKLTGLIFLSMYRKTDKYDQILHLVSVHYLCSFFFLFYLVYFLTKKINFHCWKSAALFACLNVCEVIELHILFYFNSLNLWT